MDDNSHAGTEGTVGGFQWANLRTGQHKIETGYFLNFVIFVYA